VVEFVDQRRLADPKRLVLADDEDDPVVGRRVEARDRPAEHRVDRPGGGVVLADHEQRLPHLVVPALEFGSVLAARVAGSVRLELLARDRLDRDVRLERALAEVFDAGHAPVCQRLEFPLRQPVLLIDVERFGVVDAVPAADQLVVRLGFTLRGGLGDRRVGGGGGAGARHQKDEHGDRHREGEDPSHTERYGWSGK